VSADPVPFTDILARAARLNALLVESIDESLSSLLSHQVADALFAHLEARTVTRDQISHQLDMFHYTLERVFGPSARTVEKNITKRLYGKLGLGYIEDPRMTLAGHVKYLKSQTSNTETI
jgi:AraC-like DNA-binding protein